MYFFSYPSCWPCHPNDARSRDIRHVQTFFCTVIFTRVRTTFLFNFFLGHARSFSRYSPSDDGRIHPRSAEMVKACVCVRVYYFCYYFSSGISTFFRNHLGRGPRRLFYSLEPNNNSCVLQILNSHARTSHTL